MNLPIDADDVILQELSGGNPILLEALRDQRGKIRSEHKRLVDDLDAGRIDARDFAHITNASTKRWLADLSAIVGREQVTSVFGVSADDDIVLIDPELMAGVRSEVEQVYALPLEGVVKSRTSRIRQRIVRSDRWQLIRGRKPLLILAAGAFVLVISSGVSYLVFRFSSSSSRTNASNASDAEAQDVLTSSLSRLQVEISAMKAQRAGLQSEIAELTKEYSDLSSNVEASKERLKELKQAIGRIAADVDGTSMDTGEKMLTKMARVFASIVLSHSYDIFEDNAPESSTGDWASTARWQRAVKELVEALRLLGEGRLAANADELLRQLELLAPFDEKSFPAAVGPGRDERLAATKRIREIVHAMQGSGGLDGSKR